MTTARFFASDNAAAAHPEVLLALAQVNEGHALAYGADAHTARADVLFRREFGERCWPFLVFGGTGANVAAIASLVEPWHSVICAEGAHINVDECGALERHAGCKLVDLPSPDGKLTPAAIEACLVGIGVEHHAQPGVVSITQCTEYGTVYTAAEVRAIAELAHARGLLLHMDGARLANAAAALGAALRDITVDAGVDVLSFGATKNGAVGAESVVFFREERARNFRFVRKQAGQLPSKARFIAAQFEALLADGLWRRNAEHANAMARRLAEGVRGVPGVEITQPVEANAVFATLPRDRIAPLQERFFFYVWNEGRNEVRWMTSWDTTEAEVDAFVAAVREG